MRTALFALVLVLAGCAHRETPSEPQPIAAVDIDEAAIRDAWAARIVGLDRLWARVTVVVRTVDAEGESVREQAEGHLQIEQPRGVALGLGKLGETYLYLGSNDERYWWIDRVDSDNRVAIVGRHELVTPRKAASLGVPVHPLGLIELLGIQALPEDVEFEPGPEPGTIAAVRTFAQDGPAGRSARLTWILDAESYEPRRVTVFDSDGQIAIDAAHEAYQFASVRGDTRLRPRVPGRLMVEIPGIPASVRFALYDPENKPIKPVAFDADRLFRAFRVGEVIDLDAEVSAAGDFAQGMARTLTAPAENGPDE
ncbi:MAG: hypothetical protein AAF297_02380 [Planctomycetota bacterium]